MSEASKAVMILLMLIGGSPGSTAGGMKTTTFAVLILNAIATFRSQENAGAFGRRLEYHVIKNAATIAMLYFSLFFCGGIAISVCEGLPLLDCLYEAASAVRYSRSDTGSYTGPSYFFPDRTDPADVSGTCRRTDSDLCGIFRKKQEKCKASSGKNHNWMRRRKIIS